MIDISPERIDRALNYLAETDLTYAEAKGALESSEILRKRVRARVFLTSEGTVADRQARAECDGDAEAADAEYVEAIKRFEELRARRQRAELLVDVWRSLEATRRKAA